MHRKIFIVSFITLLLVQVSKAQDLYQENDHYTKGVELFHVEKWNEASLELQKALENETLDTRKIHTEYLLVSCAAKQARDNAMTLLEDFIAKYPNSIYNNQVLFWMGELAYQQEQWDVAEVKLLSVNPFQLENKEQDRYYFKLGHSQFMMGKDTDAYKALRSVDSQSEYADHAKYYTSYMDYVAEDYTSAKTGFTELLDNANYSPIIPFYLLQIAFLQDDYTYVTEQGPALAAKAQSPRDVEILRLISESWFLLQDYGNALEYMNLYRTKGGEMNRNEYYISGYCNYQEQNWQLAADELSKACGPNDKLSQNAAYHLADCYLQLGNIKAAMQSFSIAAAYTEGDALISEDALFNYGKLQYEQGGGVFNEAINILTRYIEQYPSSTRIDEAREYLLAAYYNSNNFQAAYEAIKLLPNPDNNVKAAMQKITYFRGLEYFIQEDLDNASKLLAEADENRFNSKYTALTTYWQAEILCLKGEYQQAIPLFTNYLRLAPAYERERITALYGLGYCYFNLKDWDQATKYFNQFISLYSAKDSFVADAYNRLGDMSYADRDFWVAIEHYNKVLSINTDPQNYYAAYQRAKVLGMVNRADSKAEALTQIINEGKGDYVDDAMYELGRTYVGQAKYTQAASAFKAYLAEYPEASNSLIAMSDLGLIYQNLGDNAQALKYYTQIVESSPHTAQGRQALESVKGMYINMNDIDGFYAFASKVGAQTDNLIVERDSLSFIAAERVYLSGDMQRGESAMDGYLSAYPQGSYRTAALYFGADCAINNSNLAKAESLLTELTSMFLNDYTISGLEKLATIQREANNYEKAHQSYARLAKTAVEPKTILNALNYEVQMSEKMQDADQIIISADNALNSPYSDKNLMRTARYAKAKALEQKGASQAQISQLYRILSEEAVTKEGAEASYKIIEEAFASQDYDLTEKLVIEFSDKNSPHTYWVGKAFLMLGDVYVARDDAFQARATYQSIVDGYSPVDDGIVEQANEKIKNLK